MTSFNKTLIASALALAVNAAGAAGDFQGGGGGVLKIHDDIFVPKYPIGGDPLEDWKKKLGIEQHAEIDIPEIISGFQPHQLVTTIDGASASINGRNVFVSATGQVNTGGWRNIGLSVTQYFVPPVDGIQDFSFVGTPPSGVSFQAFQRVNASTTLPHVDWMKGVRIHSASGSIVVMLGESVGTPDNTLMQFKPGPQVMGDDAWPFPWGIKNKVQ